MIRTCFFDMGNVLVHFSHDLMCRNIGELCGWTDDRVKTFLIEEGRQWQLERGEISEEELRDQLADASGRSLPLDDFRHAAADIFRLNHSIVPVLQRLRAAGKRLVLLSNTSVTHLRFIEQRFDILNYMDDRVTSFEVGALKPDESIFRAALAKADCPAHECFYTDDIQPYVDRAGSMGIHARLYTSTELLVSSLNELRVLSD
jgi:HAD superfamily hydrolase (TIGR01509 family)